jgi:hypothetical protein
MGEKMYAPELLKRGEGVNVEERSQEGKRKCS